MQEIGGYIELDTYRLPMLHDRAIALNCGRNALAYLLKARNIQRLWIPNFICKSVVGVCERESVPFSYYSIGTDLLPDRELVLDDGEWLYFVNYYSQFDNRTIQEYVRKYRRVIVDNAQSYYQEPIPGIDTIYTCRKYFGVADGAFLASDASLETDLPLDESFDRMGFLLGRFERTASEFYAEYAANNEFFSAEPIKRMSRLTRNLLHGIDYATVEKIRRDNYLFLHEQLNGINRLTLADKTGTFMYPLLVENGPQIRKRLQAEKIYIPTLWPDVFEICRPEETAYRMAENILPLPIDQRYGKPEMTRIVEELRKCLTL